MKIIYNGNLYEENFHYSHTGYFNKEYQVKLMNSVKELLPQVIKALHSKIPYAPIKLQSKDFKSYLHNKVKDDHDASVEKYEDGFLIRFNDYYFENNVNESRIEIILKHEINHIYQFIYDKYDLNSNKKPKVQGMSNLSEDQRLYKYFNTPSEINSLINTVVNIVLSDSYVRDSLMNMSYEKFINKCYELTGYSKEAILKYIDPNGEYLSSLRGEDDDPNLDDSLALNLFTEGFNTLYAKLHQKR